MDACTINKLRLHKQFYVTSDPGIYYDGCMIDDGGLNTLLLITAVRLIIK